MYLCLHSTYGILKKKESDGCVHIYFSGFSSAFATTKAILLFLFYLKPTREKKSVT